MPTRREPSSFSVSSSWRMVDGDGNDSFDTSVVRDAYDELDEDDFIPSSPPASQATNPMSSFDPSGPVSSFDASIGSASQDSVTNYLSTADDEHLLRRTGAFRPSVPPAARRQQSSPSKEQHFSYPERDHHTPEPQFRFPKVEVESPRRGGSSRTSSTRTLRPTSYMAPEEAAELRRRARMANSTGSPPKPRRYRREESKNYDQPAVTRGASIRDRLADSVTHGVLDVVGWLFKVLGWAFNILAPLLAFVAAFLILMTAGDMIWRHYKPSIATSMSPLCNIPGVNFLNMPVCASRSSGASRRKRDPIEFDDLIAAQSSMETVLEHSSMSASLPLDMKRSESSIRDLRALVRASKLEAKDSLTLEFDGFVAATGKSADGLTRFTVEVGTTVDRILLINKHTMRYIEKLLPEDTDDSTQSEPGLLDAILARVFGLRKYSRAWSEERIRQKYIEHTYSVQERIESLLAQAQVVLRDLNTAEGHLSVILEIVARESDAVLQRQDELRPTLWSLWGLVGGSGNRAQTRVLEAQLDLLRNVDYQRGAAVEKLNQLVVELVNMRARLADLRDRVAAPGLADSVDADRSLLADVPLRMHIETITRGVEKLEEARRRIRMEENERVEEALKRGREEDLTIEDR